MSSVLSRVPQKGQVVFESSGTSWRSSSAAGASGAVARRATAATTGMAHPSRLSSLLPDDRALHTGDSRPREVDAVDLPPHVAGATDTALAGPPYPLLCSAARRLRPCIARRPTAPQPASGARVLTWMVEIVGGW